MVMMENGACLPCRAEVVKNILNAETVELVFDLNEGNFSATAFGVLEQD